MSDRFSLDNKIALITGGAGLLGMQHAICLLKAGATVYLADNNIIKAEKVAKKLGSKCIPIFLDVSKEISVKKVSKKIIKVEKKIDILINNASINHEVKKNSKNNFSRLENFDIKQWNRELSVGLTGAFLCSKYFGIEMAKQKYGIILNISSDLSVIAPSQNLYELKGLSKNHQPVKPVTYSVIKTGLIGLTLYLASYWAKENIRVNALSPGGVINKQPKEFLEKINKKILLGRMANKEEYKEAVLFLCSDASSYMTGQNIVIDGGRSIW